MELTWQDTVDIENREIFLFGDEENDITHKAALFFIKSLRLLESQSTKPIIIHQNTIGGCVVNGLAIYDAILSSSCYISCIIHGQASSMGSIIPQAADSRLMMPNAFMMIHGHHLLLDSSMKATVSYIDFHKREIKNILQILVNKAIDGEYFKDSWTESRISKFILGKLDKLEDWFLNPQEAKMYGFVDEIIGERFSTIQDYKNSL